MRLSLALPPLLAACLSAPVFAAGEFRLTGRAGLTDVPGYIVGRDQLHGLTESGWVTGFSRIGEATAAWITSPADGVSRRVGFFTGTGFGGNTPPVITSVLESGLLAGTSEYRVSEEETYPIPWVANGATGVTTLAGLPGPAFATPDGRPDSEFVAIAQNGYACGISRGYNGLPSDPPIQAAWLMNGHTGAVTRAGLFEGAPYTRIGDGRQWSQPFGFTEDGWMLGTSETFHPGTDETGQAVWIMEAATGVTRRIGLFNGGEFTGLGGVRSCTVGIPRGQDGLVGGQSTLYAANGSELGAAAWVTDTATGETRRMGLYQDARYTNPDNGAQSSRCDGAGPGGLVHGTSALHLPGHPPLFYDAWVGDARTGVCRRVGLVQEEGGDPVLMSDVFGITESGWVHGMSFRGSPDREGEGDIAMWVAETDTLVAREVGLTGPGFRNRRGYQETRVDGVTESGWAWGSSPNYGEAPGAVAARIETQAAWVARAATGETRRMGLEGAEYKHTTGATDVVVGGVSGNGKAYGYSQRWRGAKSAGYAIWVADAATGATTRLGYFDADFTAATDNYQISHTQGWTQSGLVWGRSIRYKPAPSVDISWVTDTATGRTLRLADRIIHVTESGLVAGHTSRPGTSPPEPRVAWVLNLKSGQRVDFELSAPPAGGHPSSLIQGLTPEGIAHGVYTLFRDSANLGQRAFVWSEGLGTLLFQDAKPGPGEAPGYEYLSEIRLTGQGHAVGLGKPAGSAGPGIFLGTLSALATPAPGARVRDLVRLPEGKHRLSFHTDAAVKITLQSSADLSIWKDGQTVDAPAGASHMDIEPDPAAGPHHYWRLQTAPAAP